MGLGLRRGELTGKQVLELVQLRRKYQQPSINDLSALVLAKALNIGLLTNDKSLRNTARQEGIQVHGTLWILDEMVRLQIIKNIKAVDVLRLMLDTGSRFPHDECQKRFTEWLSE